MHPLCGNGCQDLQEQAGQSPKIALWVILQAMTTTPVHDLGDTANVEPLERRTSLKILIQGQKLRRLPSHSLHTNLTQPTKNCLKRQSLNRQYKELYRKHQHITDVPIKLLIDPAWRPNREADVQMFQSVPGITWKEQFSGELTLALIADRFPHNVWTHVYTDRSAEEGMKSGGSRVCIRYPDVDTPPLWVPGGLQCSNYQAARHVLTHSDTQMLTPLPSGFLVAFSAPTIKPQGMCWPIQIPRCWHPFPLGSWWPSVLQLSSRRAPVDTFLGCVLRNAPSDMEVSCEYENKQLGCRFRCLAVSLDWERLEE